MCGEQRVKCENTCTFAKRAVFKMVDTADLFRRLTSGAKFKKQRLNQELGYLRVSSGNNVHDTSAT